MNPKAHYPVWYIQGRSDTAPLAKVESQGSGVLVDVKHIDTGKFLQLLLTAQHVVWSEREGDYYKIGAWQKGIGYHPSAVIPLEVFKPLSASEHQVFQGGDFVFLKVPEEKAWGPAAYLAPDSACVAGTAELSIHGYNGGEATIFGTEYHVTPLPLSNWKVAAIDENGAHGMIDPGEGPPGKGMSGGGVFHQGQLLGIYRGAHPKSGKHEFYPISNLRGWCKKWGYELQSPAVDAAPFAALLPKEREALLEALLQSPFALDPPMLDRILLDLPGARLTAAQADARAKLSLYVYLASGEVSHDWMSWLFDRVRREGARLLHLDVLKSMDALGHRAVKWVDLEPLKARLFAGGAVPRLPVEQARALLQGAESISQTLAFPPGGEDRSLERELSSYLDRMAGLGDDATGRRRLISFLWACQTELGLSDQEIAEWAAQFGGNPTRPAPSVEKFTPEATLRIIVEPKGAVTPPKYLVEAHWGQGDRFVQAAFSKEDVEEAALETSVLEVLLAGWRELAQRQRELDLVELFLPLRLFFYQEWHELKRPFGRRGQEIGRAWPLVLRAYDRLDRCLDAAYRDFNPDWHRKWQLVAQDASWPGKTIWVCEEHKSGTALIDFFSREAPAFKMLSPIPEGASDLTLEAVLDLALAGGLVVGFWVSEPGGDLAEWRRYVDEKLTAEPFANWPRLLRNLRQAKHPLPAQGLGLFYDGPTWSDPQRREVSQTFHNANATPVNP